MPSKNFGLCVPHSLTAFAKVKLRKSEIAAYFAHLVAEHPIVFDPMAVAIDDRMVDFRTDLFGGHMRAPHLHRRGRGITPLIVRIFRAPRHK